MGSKYAIAGMALVAIAIGLALSLSAANEQRPLVPVPNVPKRYWYLYEPNWPNRDEEYAAAWAGLPFESITLDRKGGLGGEAYAFTVHRGGKAAFEADIKGRGRSKFAGTVTVSDYGRLCYLLEKLRVKDMRGDIRAEKVHGSHGFSATVQAVARNEADSIEIWEMSGCGPIELWAVQMTMDGVRATIEWNAP